MAAGNSSYSAAITRTLQDHGTKIFDAVVSNNTVLYFLRQKGNIKLSSGGRSFTHPVYYKQNTSYGSYSKLETIRTPIMEDYTRAEYDIKVVAGSIVMSIQDLAENAGDKAKLLDYGKTLRMAAQVSMEEVMGDQMFANGTSNPKDFGGLPFLINDTPSSQTDVGGINPSTSGNEYWRNIVGTLVTGFNTSDAGRKSMDAAVLEATKGRRGPTLVVTTKTIYALYDVSLLSGYRYQSADMSKPGDAKFRSLAYMTMPFVFDDSCTSERMFMVDLDSLQLQLLARGNFQVTPFERTHNQLSETALMYVFGNMTCGSRRTQAVITVTG